MRTQLADAGCTDCRMQAVTHLKVHSRQQTLREGCKTACGSLRAQPTSKKHLELRDAIQFGDQESILSVTDLIHQGAAQLRMPGSARASNPGPGRRRRRVSSSSAQSCEDGQGCTINERWTSRARSWTRAQLWRMRARQSMRCLTTSL